MEKVFKNKILIISTSCVMALVIGIMSFFAFRGIIDKGGKAEVPEDIIIDEGGPVTDGAGNVLPSDEVIPMPSHMVFSSAQLLGEEDYSKITVSVNVVPDYAGITSVSAGLRFSDVDNSWASGKKTEDYVRLIHENNSKDITLECVQPFGCPILLVVTVVDKLGISFDAECRLDFQKRVDSFEIFYSSHYKSVSKSGKISSEQVGSPAPIEGYVFGDFVIDDIRYTYTPFTIDVKNLGLSFDLDCNLNADILDQAASAGDFSIPEYYLFQSGYCQFSAKGYTQKFIDVICSLYNDVEQDLKKVSTLDPAVIVKIGEYLKTAVPSADSNVFAFTLKCNGTSGKFRNFKLDLRQNINFEAGVSSVTLTKTVIVY